MESQHDCADPRCDSLAAVAAAWLADLQQERVIVVDLRPAHSFAGGFIPGSLSVPAPSCFAVLAATTVLKDREVLLLPSDDLSIAEVKEIVQSLGNPSTTGCLDPTILDLWRQKVGMLGKIEEISADNLAVRLAAWKTLVVDIRGSDEDQTARIPDAIHIPMEQLPSSMAGLPEKTNITVVCSAGENASLAASLLWRMGYHNVSTLIGGVASYVRRGYRVVKQPSSHK